MKVYFDMCCLQRPLDDKGQLRVLVEAEAILGVLARCESGMVSLIASDALFFEADANPDAVRRDFAAQVLAKATHLVMTSPEIRNCAQKYIEAGVKSLDALHLASAIEGQADFFCTCDDRLLRKSATLDTSRTKILSPLQLVLELEP